MLVYLSSKNLNCKEIDVYHNEMKDTNYFLLQAINGNTIRPRIPMHQDIVDALSVIALSYKNKSEMKGKEFYVHIPSTPTSNYIIPTPIDVPYVDYVREVWFTNNITVKCIGKIKVNDIYDIGWMLDRKYKYNGNVIDGYYYNYDWVNKYYSDTFVEESSSNTNSNSIYFASFDKGLKYINPEDFANREVVAYKSKKLAIIMGCGNRGDKLSVDLYGKKGPNTAVISIYIKDYNIKLDKSFSLYELDPKDFYNKDNDKVESTRYNKSKVKVLNEYKYDSWVKTVGESGKHNVRFEYYNGITEEQAVKYGGYYSEEGIWNSIVRDENTGKLLRKRVETVIINRDKVFLRMIPKSNNTRYRLPGGSTEKGLSLKDQAINEVNEEAILNIKNIFYTGIKYINYKKANWNTNCIIPWEGKETHVFVAEYNGKYKKTVHKIDKDNDMSSNGRFYKITEVWDMLSSSHKRAIQMYIRKRNKKKLYNKIKNLKENINNHNFKRSNIILKELSKMDTEFTDEVIIGSLATQLNIDKNNINYFDINLPKCLPCFTPDEMEDLGVFNENPENNYYNIKSNMDFIDWYNEYKLTGNPGNNWINMVRSVYEDYVKDKSNLNKQRLLEIGWNPSVNLNDKVLNLVRENTRKNLNNKYGSIVIDTDILKENGVTVSTRDIMEKIVSKCILFIQDQYINKKDAIMKDVFDSIMVYNEKEEEWNDDNTSCIFARGLRHIDINNFEFIKEMVGKLNEYLESESIFDYEVYIDGTKEKFDIVLKWRPVSGETEY